jgi:ketosteroid isomerase-like protein
MSEENVEIVRAHIEAFRRGDSSDALSYIDSYVVWDASRIRSLDIRLAYGLKEFGETMRHHIGAFKDLEPQRATDLGSGAVLVLGIEKERRGKGHAVPVRQSFAALYTVIDGKIARITFFPSEGEVLHAAGLSE